MCVSFISPFFFCFCYALSVRVNYAHACDVIKVSKRVGDYVKYGALMSWAYLFHIPEILSSFPTMFYRSID